MKTKKSIFTIAAILIMAVNLSWTQSIERFAIYVGSNRGGLGRTTLRYAGQDAKRLSETMIELGGIKEKNTHILINPKGTDIDEAISLVAKDVDDVKTSAKRVEFLFYYSGHSDEDALLLGNEKYSYSKLKQTLSNVKSEVQVVMLDSCFSGNFIRAKGGQRQKSFLSDDSTIVQGHAYLSSSSESESSQESDVIGSSFFTNSMVTGLRGAADTSGDKKVSLNELYYYAFYDTLKQTEDSSAGPQHPSYNITLVGSGDLILTDISVAEAVLVLSANNSGHFLIRNDKGVLVSEVTKIPGSPTSLALPSGNYTITLVTKDETLQKEVELKNNSPYILNSNKMELLARAETTSRGNATTVDVDEDKDENTEEQVVYKSEFTPFHFTFVDRLQFPYLENPEELNSSNISLIFIDGTDKKVNGLQASVLLGTITESLSGAQVALIHAENKGTGNGFQASGIFSGANDHSGTQASGIFSTSNIINGVQASGIFSQSNTHNGVQASGIFNTTKDLIGIQAAGIFNTNKNSKGIQAAGIFNVTKESLGVQTAGIFNFSQNVIGIQTAGVLNFAFDVKGFQNGVLNATKTFKGAQFGVVNFSVKDNSGFAFGLVNISMGFKGAPIGLINIMPNNICEGAFFIDTLGNGCFQFQGGSDYVFTTLIYGNKFGGTYKNQVFGWGLGARAYFFNRFLSIDFETIAKDYITENKDKDSASFVPEFRVTANFRIYKRLKVFVGCCADVKVNGWNDRLFSNQNYATLYENNDCGIFGSMQLGVKF